MAVPVVSFPKFGLPALHARPAGPMQVSAELLAAGRKNVGVLRGIEELGSKLQVVAFGEVEVLE